jgi:hypothetical protein
VWEHQEQGCIWSSVTGLRLTPMPMSNQCLGTSSLLTRHGNRHSLDSRIYLIITFLRLDPHNFYKL